MPPESLGACGLGLRQQFLDSLMGQWHTANIDFLEVAPENWIGVYGRGAELLDAYTKKCPVICHGLTLSIGGIPPINKAFLRQLKTFFNQHQTVLYSEHLSYCNDEYGQLYDLMPIPFTEEAVYYVANRVREVQDYLERPVALENVSYYACPKGDLSESEFINAVLEEANCLLLLDVNNVYVNSINHHYDANNFLAKMPAERIAYIHMAGHLQKEQDLIIDTHGDRIADPVWKLLNQVYSMHGVIPTLIERDNDVPSLDDMLKEVALLKEHQKKTISKKSSRGVPAYAT